MWRKGWCRNPLLFSPQQSHLVSYDDLDCERGMGNYWEAVSSAQPAEPAGMRSGFQEPVALAFSGFNTQPTRLVSETGTPVYPVSGAAGQGGERPPYDEPPGGGWSGGDPPITSGREYNYFPEERYWTDYLRIAAPIFGVILMVFLFWWWISNFIGDDSDDNGSIGSSTATVTIPTVGETEAPVVEPTATEGSGIIIPEGTATLAPGVPTQPPPSSGLYDGATVEVYNTGGTGVNVRTRPSTDADIVTVFLDGTILTVIGDSATAEGFVWWPVSGDGIEGYVVQDYLFLID